MTYLVVHCDGIKDLPDLINQDFLSLRWKIAISSLTTSASTAPFISFMSLLHILATNALRKNR